MQRMLQAMKFTIVSNEPPIIDANPPPPIIPPQIELEKPIEAEPKKIIEVKKRRPIL